MRVGERNAPAEMSVGHAAALLVDDEEVSLTEGVDEGVGVEEEAA